MLCDSSSGPFAPFENIEGDGDTLYAYARFLNKIFYSFNGGEDWLTSAIPAHQGYFGEITCLKKTVDSVYAFVHQSGRHIVIARKNEGGMMHPGPAAANHIRIKFAPNPGDPLNGTTVEFTDGSVNNESVDTKIYDLSGHLMLQTTIQANDNKATLPKMPKGIYDVQVRLGKKTGAGIMLCN